MYGFGRLQRRTICVFNQFQPYDNIAEKGGAGGLKKYFGSMPGFLSVLIGIDQHYTLIKEVLHMNVFEKKIQY